MTPKVTRPGDSNGFDPEWYEAKVTAAQAGQQAAMKYASEKAAEATAYKNKAFDLELDRDLWRILAIVWGISLVILLVGFLFNF